MQIDLVFVAELLIFMLFQVLEKHDVKKEHVKCTNLGHLEALVNCILENCDGCSGILETLELRTSDDSKRVCVDVVADNGRTWIKVVARNPKALSLLSAGESYVFSWLLFLLLCVILWYSA